MNKRHDASLVAEATVGLHVSAGGCLGAAIFSFIGLVCLMVAISQGVFKPGGVRLPTGLAEGIVEELLITITNLVAPIGLALVPAEAIGLLLALVSRVAGYRQVARGLIIAALLGIALTVLAVVLFIGTCSMTGCLRLA